MAVSVHDVARELRQRLRGAGDVKVHKLLYYCQGWHLARYGEPMFEEPIEGWANGPVVADLWRAEKWGHEVPHAQDLDEAMLETLDVVLSRYSRLSGKDLIELTHSEPPWREVSDRVEPWDDQTIRSELLKDFFATLKDHEAFSLRPFSMTPERRRIIEDAKARAQK